MNDNTNSAGMPSNNPINNPTLDNSPKNRSAWDTIEGRVISLVSRKGGVGKTTSAVNLGAALALSGHSVLVISTDSQCGVSQTLGLDATTAEIKLGDLFDDFLQLTDLAYASALEGLHFITPGIASLEQEEEFQDNLSKRADDFVNAVDQARKFYDTILIDCPPNLGPATRAALLASDSYLVPVQAEELCRESLGSLINFVNSFRDRHFSREAGFLDLQETDVTGTQEPQPIELEGMFLTMANEHTRMGRHVAAKVTEQYGHHLLETSIPRTTRLSEMALKGKPAVIYDRRSKGSRAYFDLADELVNSYRLRRELIEQNPAVEMDTEPAMDNPLPPALESPVEQVREAAAPEESGGGLDGFLKALGGAEAVSANIPAFEEPQVPEMVSLDDLLAEEESQNQDPDNDDWNEGMWPEQANRLN